ncbi:MAG: DUF4276 family protein [Bacteroidetes bacterium]|nr:DUF4276 family protein [Bacteroidota bacterium]
MKSLRFTLIAEGSSDQALIAVLKWLLSDCGVTSVVQPQWADLYHLPRKPRGLVERIRTALAEFECELLFVHRDADRDGYNKRKLEIESAIETLARTDGIVPPVVCVIPIRMSEAWLLFDEKAIRTASGNPHGNVPLSLPSMATIEAVPDPKKLLAELIRRASGLTGRRLKRLRASSRLVAENISDFGPLSRLTAFQTLRDDLAKIVKREAWGVGNSG